MHSSNIKKHIENLDDIAFRVLSNSSSSIIVSDTSIKNYITTSISHIYSYDRPIIKTIHKAVNVSQIRYSLVVILGLNSVSGVQYKDMMIDR